MKHPRRKQDICRHTAVYLEKDRDHSWDLAADDGIIFKSIFGKFFVRMWIWLKWSKNGSNSAWYDHDQSSTIASGGLQVTCISLHENYDAQFDMIYLSTAIGLTPSGSSTVHIYTWTIHRTTQITTNKLHLVPRLRLSGAVPSLRHTSSCHAKG